jgi:hypothetical protein
LWQKKPQSAYSGLQKSLQQEWQFVQRVRKDIGDEFTEIEEAISLLFLPSKLGDDYMMMMTLTIASPVS